MTGQDSSDSKDMLDKVEAILAPILSPRQPMDSVEQSISTLSNQGQRFALHWIKVVSVTNIELTYSFSILVGQAMAVLGLKGSRVWLLESLALYDREGLYPAILALQDIRGFNKQYVRKTYTCHLSEVKPHLDIFIRGLAGRALTLKTGTEIFTDTQHLFLPESISKYRDKEKNRALFKAMACFLWAQTWYGTFRRNGYASPTTQARLDNYAEPETAKHHFLALENIRLLAKIQRDLPGLHREMSTLCPLIMPNDATWKIVKQKLDHASASVEDTFEALDVLIRLNISISATDYQGGLNLNEVELQIENRKNKVLSEIEKLLNKNKIAPEQLEQAIDTFNAAQQGAEQENDDAMQRGGDSLQELDEKGGGISQEESLLQELLQALNQDVAHFDDGLLGNMSNFDREGGVGSSAEQSLLKKTKSSKRDDLLELDEWDYLRQNYRKRWCQVRVSEVVGIQDGFRQKTKEKYPFLLAQIRKIFESMRDQPRYANRQTDGDDIDLDAVVDTYTAKLAGEELSERMYIRRQRNERSVSICLLVDMSGSTKGWINLTIRESLILFSEALNTLGDQYAILGFSGLTRQRCEIYTVKKFSDTRAQEVSDRIGNIQAKDYTRMGFAVRYATQCLLKSEAKHRILLMLSDGKPDDYDGYQGEYGIQDTRKAILEAQGHAINPYSITIDKQAQVYLPRLFGPGKYMILDEVKTLPLKLSEVYKNLST